MQLLSGTAVTELDHVDKRFSSQQCGVEIHNQEFLHSKKEKKIVILLSINYKP